MALNLSRNTKVFVSSVNGVGATGGVKTCHVSTAGDNYAVGDIVTFTGGSGTGFKCIVRAITGGGADGPVSEIMVPNNFRGKAYAAGETLTESAVHSLGNPSTNVDRTGTTGGLVVTVGAIAATITADGARAGTGKFKGNEKDANTFRLGVLDGYSFSQGSDSTDVTISEAGAAPNRGSKTFNDSLPPAEWSFGTYVRPFIHGANSFRTAADHDCVENILWAALSGTQLPNEAAGTGRGVIITANDSICGFTKSDVHELMKINLYFALENTTYRLNDAQVNQAEVDFSIDGIAQVTWSGNATTIDQVEEALEDPSKFIIQGTTLTTPAARELNLAGSGEGTTDTRVETFNYVDTTGPSDADYLRNKLSTLYLDSDLQGGGKASQGLDNTLYDINITGGSLTIANNVTYVTPETIGVVDKPIGSFTGARVISGSLNMYLDTKANGSNKLLTDLAAATDLVTNVFDMRLFMGVAGTTATENAGTGIAANSTFTGAGVEFKMPKAHIQVPVIEVGDLISVSLDFSAHGTDLLTGDELTVRYQGATSHTQVGYKDTGAHALDAA